MSLSRHSSVTNVWVLFFHRVSAFSTVWNVSFALYSLSISAHLSFLSFSIACQQERKHGRRLTEQTGYIPGWAPMSYVSFSCCIALPFPAAICTHGPEQAKLCSSLLRILFWGSGHCWHKADLLVDFNITGVVLSTENELFATVLKQQRCWWKYIYETLQSDSPEKVQIFGFPK